MAEHVAGMSEGQKKRALETADTAMETSSGVSRRESVDEVPWPDGVRPGVLLLDRYELLGPLAEGGMAAVWRGKDSTLGTDVAIKFTTRFEPQVIERFQQEALLTARLGSPNIVQILDVGQIESVPFIVMELLEGESLAEALLARGTLGFREVVSLISQAARALEKAHRAGVIHRDVKPSNIFLVPDGPETLVKMLDFGVAKNFHQPRTMAGDFIGTPQYMSIEQALDPSSVDGRSDLWSLAVVAYEALVGKRAFNGTSATEILRNISLKPLPIPSESGPVPPQFDTWFARAAARAPEDRFQNAAEFVQELKGALLEREQVAFSRPTSPPETVEPKTKRVSIEGTMVSADDD